MLLEADLIRIIRVRFVAVDGLRAVRVVDPMLGALFLRRRSCVHAAELRGGRVAGLRAGGAAGIAGDGGGGFEAVELGRSIHLRLLVVGNLGLGAVGVAVGDGARLARARVLLVQGVGVDKSAVAGGGLGAVVEDPDNLGESAKQSEIVEEGAYRDHGEQDVAGSCGLEGSDGRVDQRVDRGSSEDEASGKEAHDLCLSAGAFGAGQDQTYCNMVGPLSIRGDGDCDANNAEEHEDQCPPGEVGEAAANG